MSNAKMLHVSAAWQTHGAFIITKRGFCLKDPDLFYLGIVLKITGF